MSKAQEMRERAKTLDKEKLATVLGVLRTLYPEGKENAPGLIPVLHFIADAMQVVLDEEDIK